MENYGYIFDLVTKNLSNNAIDFSDHKSRLFVGAIDFVDSVNEAGVSEGEVLLHGVFPVLFNSLAHDLLETRVDNVQLFSTL